MKKLFAIVLVVALLASVSGVALAKDFDNYKEVGHGALNGPHYNLNIIGVENGNKTADMTNTSGHTIFVNLKGRTKIMLVDSANTTHPDYCCNGKDFYVCDRNGTDGEAVFCLPAPVESGRGDCPGGYVTVHYTVFARALGQPGNKSFTTTCATDPSDNLVYCSSITMKLDRKNGKSTFMDVTKYLLYLYLDGVRYKLFDPKLKDYFWRYDNDGLRLAQLRFYMTETCVPETVPDLDIEPDCGAKGTDVPVVVTGSVGTDLDGITKQMIDIFPQNAGLSITGSVTSAPTTLSFTLRIASDAWEGDYMLYMKDQTTGEDYNVIFRVPCPT